MFAYSLKDIEKRLVLLAAKKWGKNKIIDEAQWSKIREEFQDNLFSPSIVMKLLLFLGTLIGLLTLSGPILFVFLDGGVGVLQVVCLLSGIALIYFNEIVMIKEKLHYKSGVTEAISYAATAFIAFGLIGENNDMHEVVYELLWLVFSLVLCIRYLDKLALLSTLFACGWILFRFLIQLGGIFEAIIPFALMTFSTAVFLVTKKLQNRFTSFVFDNYFIILKSFSLLLFYSSANYFVVRELSVELMGLHLTEGEDIPFAFLFYFLTAAVPLFYLFYGVKSRSILWIRIGLFCIAASVITFKFYFSLGYPMVTVTIAGAILLTLSLLLLNYFKKIRNGFTREKLMDDKWSSQDLTAFVVSQTSGGDLQEPSEDDLFKGGEFGGGGAGGNW